MPGSGCRLHFLGWIMMANLINTGISTPRCRNPANLPRFPRPADLFGINIWEWFLGCGLILLLHRVSGPCASPTMGPGELPGPLAASDSLRNAVRKAVADLPAGTPGLRLLARPPVTFYLGGRVRRCRWNLTWRGCSRLGDPRFWALVDLAQLRQEGDPKTASAALLGPLGARPRIPDTTEPCRPCWISIRVLPGPAGRSR